MEMTIVPVKRAQVMAGPPIQRVGGHKFGLQVTGDLDDAEVTDGLQLLKAAQTAYKLATRTTKAAARVTQQTEARAAADGAADVRRDAQIEAQTKYTTALKAAEMTPQGLVAAAGDDFAYVPATQTITYKTKLVANVRTGGAAYHLTTPAISAAHSAIYKRHTLDGDSAQEYVDDGTGHHLRRMAYRGVTQTEQQQLKNGDDLVPLNATTRAAAELGYGSDGSPRAPEKGTDLATLNHVAGTTLPAVPLNDEVQAFLQVRKGVGKYFSATSTSKPITSNHDAAFTDDGLVKFDLARVAQPDLLHHYKSPALNAASIHGTLGGGGVAPHALRSSVDRGNESVVRNRELVLKQIPHDAVVSVDGGTHAEFTAAYEARYRYMFKTGYTQAITHSGLPFEEGFEYVYPDFAVPAAPGFGAGDGSEAANAPGLAAGGDAAALAIAAGRDFVAAFEARYSEGWEFSYQDGFYAELEATDLEPGEWPEPPTAPAGPPLTRIPASAARAAALTARETLGQVAGTAAWAAH